MARPPPPVGWAILPVPLRRESSGGAYELNDAQDKDMNRLNTFALLSIAILLVVSGIRHSAATSVDIQYTIYNAVMCFVVVICAGGIACVSASHSSQTARNYSILVAVLAVVIAATPIAATSYRTKTTISRLSDLYSNLSQPGPPFPEPSDINWGNPTGVMISHGYWVSDDKQTFEVFYHDSSDSFTMAYPTGQWEWRPNQYQGPDSKPRVGTIQK